MNADLFIPLPSAPPRGFVPEPSSAKFHLPKPHGISQSHPIRGTMLKEDTASSAPRITVSSPLDSAVSNELMASSGLSPAAHRVRWWEHRRRARRRVSRVVGGGRGSAAPKWE